MSQSEIVPSNPNAAISFGGAFVVGSSWRNASVNSFRLIDTLKIIKGCRRVFIVYFQALLLLRPEGTHDSHCRE